MNSPRWPWGCEAVLIGNSLAGVFKKPTNISKAFIHHHSQTRGKQTTGLSYTIIVGKSALPDNGTSSKSNNQLCYMGMALEKR